ncbi:hypothetical protein [Chamaesiphon sp.]|uniref:hypothetical protein n=1 Tax=Chamaesiphon sp. TaxID=2814140 RepID=UPI003593DBD5
MINYVSLGGESIDRALQTLLTCYGASYQQHVFQRLPDWQLDELLCDHQVHAIVSECDPIEFSTYLDRLPLKIDTRAHWWQVLPPCHKQIQKVVSSVVTLKSKYRHLRYSFFLDRAYHPSVWRTVFTKVDALVLKPIVEDNILFKIPDFDLKRLNYTSCNRQIHSCLVYPRSDRHTNAKVADLLLTLSQIHPYFYY